MNGGFYKRRRGILEWIESGVVDLLESGIYDYLLLKANLVIGNGYRLPAGEVLISAQEIHAHCKRVSERTIQRCLEHLEDVGWIRRRIIPGKRGNYLTLICRASVHDLSGNEYRVNGAATTDWSHPVYEPVAELSGSCRQSVRSLASLREVRVESREKREHQHQVARVSPQEDSLKRETKEAAFNVFWERWPRKQQKSAAARAWMKIPISEYAAITNGLERWEKSDQWNRGVIPHPATWLNQKRWQDEDIPQSGGTNGAGPTRKATGTELATRNWKALGLDRRPN